MDGEDGKASQAWYDDISKVQVLTLAPRRAAAASSPYAGPFQSHVSHWLWDRELVVGTLITRLGLVPSRRAGGPRGALALVRMAAHSGTLDPMPASVRPTNH